MNSKEFIENYEQPKFEIEISKEEEEMLKEIFNFYSELKVCILLTILIDEVFL